MNPIQKHKQIIVLLLAGLLALPLRAEDAPAAKTGDKPASAPDEAQMMAVMMEMAKPGENHKRLADMAGEWTYTVKYWMSPDPKAALMESTGKTVSKPIMGGRYVQSEHTGKMQMPGADGAMMDMEFKGMAIEGYDNAKKKFVSSWVDNMGTGIMHAEGTYDQATKTVTYLSEYEPMPGMKTKVRQLVKITDQDHHTLEFYEDRGGQEAKTMEIIYTRKK